MSSSMPVLLHRPAQAHGRLDLDWMECCHHFSFGRFQDPERISWGKLRVLNRNRMKPKLSSPTRPHHNLEMLFFVHTGTLMLRRSGGERQLVQPGQALLVSAGIGIDFAIGNPARDELTYTEVAIVPDKLNTRAFVRGIDNYREADERVVVASGMTGVAGLVSILADASVERSRLRSGETRIARIGSGRLAYLVVLSGRVHAGGISLEHEDGLAIAAAETVEIVAQADAELLIIASAA